MSTTSTPDIALYDLVVPYLLANLGNLRAFLQKGEEWNKAQNHPESNLTEGKLAPDMYDLTFQVHVVAKMAYSAIVGPAWKFDAASKGVGERPRDFAGMYKYIDDAISFLQGVKREDFEGGPTREITVWPSGTEGVGPEFKFSSGLNFLRQFIIGNTGFHVTTAYNILRAKGVPLGKRDYLFSVGGPE